MRIAFVGPPQSGKSTLFRAVTGQAPPDHYEPGEHLGAVKVPDTRLDWLDDLIKPPKKVEAVDGFSLAEAEPLEGDELAAVVRWNGSGDLSALEGQLLSVRLHLNKAKVYSIAM